MRWTVTHAAKKLGHYGRGLLIQIPTAGVVTAEAYTICLSQLEHEFATDTRRGWLEQADVINTLPLKKLRKLFKRYG